MSTPDMEYEPDEQERAVLDVLREHGRANPMLIREETDLRKEYVSRALDGLQKAQVVRKVTRGLYEHVPENDDEYGGGDDLDPEALQQKIQDLRAERDRLQERVDELETLRTFDLATLQVALDDLEQAADRGNGQALQDALRRAREAIDDAE